MNNIKIKIKNFSAGFFAIRKNLVLLFYLGLVVLLVFEFFAMQASLRLIFASQKEQPPSRSVQKVRVNFEDFKQNKARLDAAQNFVPNLIAPQNPFKIKQ